MTASRVDDLIAVGRDVLSTVLSSATNFILAQIGDVVTSKVSSDNAEWWQHVGFASRPRKPDAGSSAAQVVVVTKGDHDAVIASRDSRVASIYGQLDHGETAVFASIGGAIAIFKKDGSIEITGGTVKIGDSSAEALAMGAALEALWNMLSANKAVIDGVVLTVTGSALPQPLSAFFTAHATEKLKTTKAEGT